METLVEAEYTHALFLLETRDIVDVDPRVRLLLARQAIADRNLPGRMEESYEKVLAARTEILGMIDQVLRDPRHPMPLTTAQIEVARSRSLAS